MYEKNLLEEEYQRSNCLITQEEEDAGRGYCEECKLCKFLLIQLCQKEEEFQTVMRLDSRDDVINAINYFLLFRQQDVTFSNLYGNSGFFQFHRWVKEKELFADKEWMEEVNKELSGIQIYKFNCQRMKM